MAHEIKVHFYLQAKKGKHLIIARSARNGKIVLRSTGYEIDASKWDKKNQEPLTDIAGTKVILKSLRTLRNKLNKLKGDLENYWKESKDTTITFDEVWSAVVDGKPTGETGSVFVSKGLEIYASTKSARNKVNIDQVTLAIKGFKPNLKFKEFDSMILKNYFDFLRSKKQGRHKKKFGIEESTINAHRTILKRCAEYMFRRGYPVHLDLLELKSEKVIYKEGVPLTIEEIHSLKDYKGYTENEERAVDLFLFESLSGMRHGDITRLLENSLQYNEELGHHLQIIDNKTRRPRIVTVHNLNKPIIDKYIEGDPARKLFPPVPSMNRLIKSAAKKVGLNRLYNEIPGKQPRPIHEIISSHDGRHTYVALLSRLIDSDRIVNNEIGWVKRGDLLSNVYGRDIQHRVNTVRNAVNSLQPQRGKQVRMTA